MMQSDSTALPALPPGIADQVEIAVAEDLGPGDVTAALVPANATARATIVAREGGIVCGTAWVEATFARLTAGATRIDWHRRDSQVCREGDVLCILEGPARGLLSGERTALNFLQTLSGTATQTRRFAEALEGTRCRLLDTRKTIPGLRVAQKYAVRCGGGSNHRLGLFDGVLIKENHIAAGGGITATIARARLERASLAIEVEVETLAQLDEAITAGADIVMLDNFDETAMREAVGRVEAAGARVRLEASGNVTLENIAQVAATGVDYVSVGALTKDVRALDLSLRILSVD